MKADRYEREREKVRASKSPAQFKAARLAHIDLRETRTLERRMKRDAKKLAQLRERAEARERECARADLRRDLHRSLSRYEELPEGA